MNPLDFLETAHDLATSSARRPRQTNLRRAVSTTYYALFHCLAKCCADMVVGGAGSDRSRPAWRQTYRALGHGTARKRCEHRKNIRQYPAEIQDLAKSADRLLQARTRAPPVRVRWRTLTRARADIHT